ncbi:hypothetical protein PUN28_000097 [Cardiocondyla obscurior]|uniref:Uncharacterized protein n=1 Tax=Cardiocondyla obscurior TaxID=286306 RepID=A0AAW2GXZ7_9HYME
MLSSFLFCCLKGKQKTTYYSERGRKTVPLTVLVHITVIKPDRYFCKPLKIPQFFSECSFYLTPSDACHIEIEIATFFFTIKF